MVFENIAVEVQEQIALIKIDRPKFLNALNKQTIQELNTCFEDLEKNKSIRVIILTGEGRKSFIAGADIKEFITFNKKQGKKLSEEGHKLLFDKVAALSKPVIAVINGFALGGGLELAMSCHIRLASDNAKLGLPELTLGLIPGYGGTQRLMQLIGKGKALEMMLSSEMISAEDALKHGLVNNVYSSDTLIDQSLILAKRIASNSPNAVAKLLEAVHIGSNIDKGLKSEIELFGACFGTEDFKEGTQAFLQKRKPNFN